MTALALDALAAALIAHLWGTKWADPILLTTIMGTQKTLHQMFNKTPPTAPIAAPTVTHQAMTKAFFFWFLGYTTLKVPQLFGLGALQQQAVQSKPQTIFAHDCCEVQTKPFFSGAHTLPQGGGGACRPFWKFWLPSAETPSPPPGWG